MKKKIPFTKEIPFKTMISEITDINLEHDLEILNNSIEGNFIISGKYKMTDASVIEEDFLHKLPFTIEMDDKYDLSKSKISINDFYFEIINEEILKVNIEVLIEDYFEKEKTTDISLNLDNIRKTLEVSDIKEETELLDDVSVNIDELKIEPTIEEITNQPETKVQIQEEEKIEAVSSINQVKENVKLSDEVKTDTTNSQNNVTSIFSSIPTDETFSTYHVYIVRENDTLEEILDKYKVLKEDVNNYNDLSDIKVGSKLIIPCSNE